MPIAELICFCATKLRAHCGVDAHLFVEELQNKVKLYLGVSAQANRRAAANPEAWQHYQSYIRSFSSYQIG